MGAFSRAITQAVVVGTASGLRSNRMSGRLALFNEDGSPFAAVNPPVDPAANTPGLRTLGTGDQQAAVGSSVSALEGSVAKKVTQSTATFQVAYGRASNAETTYAVTASAAAGLAQRTTVAPLNRLKATNATESDDLTTLAQMDAQRIGAFCSVGNLVMCAGGSQGVATSWTKDEVRWVPVVIRGTWTFDAIIVNCAAAVSGALGRIGLGTINSTSGVTMVNDLGTVDLSTTGNKGALFPTPKTLSPGIYALGLALQGTAAGQVWATGNAPLIVPGFPGSLATACLAINSSAAGALPTTSSISPGSVAPALGLRRSA